MSNTRIQVLALRQPSPTRPRRRQAPGAARRIPLQARAHDTVETILEAATQILQVHGRDALNTNAIAERAGISVGSLYQYFPNKREILLAMGRRELARVRAAVMKAIGQTEQGHSIEPARLAIRAMIRAFGTRHRARRIVMQAMIAEDLTEELQRDIREITSVLDARARRYLPHDRVSISTIGLFVVTRAVDGVIRAAALEEVPFFTSVEFEDELVKLVNRYLAGA